MPRNLLVGPYRPYFNAVLLGVNGEASETKYVPHKGNP